MWTTGSPSFIEREVNVIDIPTNARVDFSDGASGQSTYVVANPVTRQITHLVVKNDWPPFRETLVPIELVEETGPDWIHLKCSKAALDRMQPFEVQEYIRTEKPDYLNWPYVLPSGSLVPLEGLTPLEQVEYVPIKRQNIAPEEIAVRRGTRVEATDGYVGQVDELLVNSNNLQVTHLVLSERHIFKHREITIPVSQIDSMIDNTVYLKLDKKSVEELPTTPVQRWPREENIEARVNDALMNNKEIRKRISKNFK
jgi:hypothetical protein